MRKVYVVRSTSYRYGTQDKIFHNKVFGSYDRTARYLKSLGLSFIKSPDSGIEYWSGLKAAHGSTYSIEELEVEE